MSDHLEEPPLPPGTARAVVRLLGGVATIDSGHADKKRMLMNGLRDLIRADAWAWTLACQFEPDKPPVYVAWMQNGFSDDRYARYLRAVEHPASQAMTGSLIEEVRTQNRHLTRTIEQIDRAGQFPYFEAAPLWREANIGTLLISARPLDDQSASGVGIYRNLGGEPFTAEECELAHLILSEVPWLHEQGWPVDLGATVPQLSARQRLLLNLLLEGRSRKDIAEHLGLSIHTVSGYVKEIYRHFGVQSHAALITRFFTGSPENTKVPN